MGDSLRATSSPWQLCHFLHLFLILMAVPFLAYRKKPLYVDLPRDPAVFVDSSHDPVSVKFPHQSVPDSLVNSSQDLVSVRDDAKAKGVQGSDPSATNDQDSVSSDESQGCATGDTLEGQVDIVIPDSIEDCTASDSLDGRGDASKQIGEARNHGKRQRSEGNGRSVGSLDWVVNLNHGNYATFW